MSGTLIGIIGIGGVLLVPALVLFGGLGVEEATPVATMSFFFTRVAGTFAYSRADRISWESVRWLMAYNDYPIRNEIIYRIATVTPVGGPMTIADPAFDDERSPGGDQLGRPPVAQTFSAGEEVFTVMVNHFKSKSCTASSGADADQGDGQACYNARRVLQAERVLEFVGEIQTASGDPDVLVVGDINSYSEEDPVLTLETELTNVLDMYVADQYSFNFFAASAAPWIGRGALDQALATPGMALKTTGAAIWHINADEPTALGWSGSDLTLIAPAEFRSSDHDALLIGVELPTAFLDIAGNVFKNDILFMSAAGITFGCNPPTNDNYCPQDQLTRGQIAAFFNRVVG